MLMLGEVDALNSVRNAKIFTHVELQTSYRAFHGFGPAIFTYVGLILGSHKFTLLPQLPLKSGQI